MNRLTVPDKKIEGGTSRAVIDGRAVREAAMTIYWALKKYEDTGLTSEQIIEYQRAKEEGRLHIIPNIKLYKTLYWIWGGEIMPVKYFGINGGCIDGKGKFRITCEMRTKKERTFIHKKKDIVIKKGDARYFYADDIEKDVFLSRKEAEAKLAEMEGGHE